MRATTAFNKMLAVPRASVVDVTFGPTTITVDLRRRFRRLRCPCGWSTRARYDASTRSWRAPDLAGSRVMLRTQIRRLNCRACGRVRTEAVPWARPGSRFTTDFEDIVAWLAQRTDKTAIQDLMRCSWQAVADIVTRVVADYLDDTRLDGLYRIGIDEVSYRKHHRYLTVVADHDRDAAVVWVGEGRNAATLTRFYQQLGEARAQQLQAVSLDMGQAYAAATNRHAAQAAQCIDPFHLIQLCNNALDHTRRWAVRQARGTHRAPTAAGYPSRGGNAKDSPTRALKNLRWALLKDPDHLTDRQRHQLAQLRRERHILYRAYQLKEELRDLYRLPDDARPDVHLDAWLAHACRSRIPAMVRLSRTVRTNRDRILAAVTLDLANAKLEGLNSKIRLINHRGYGHHSTTALTAMIYLCCGGLTIKLPTQT